jgi:cobalt-zinc-cadmium efflux system membrane fusion protein
MRYLKALFLISCAILLTACVYDARNSDHNDHGAEVGSEVPTITITEWTDRMELFMEYPPLVKGMQERFIVHLTILDKFQPVREGGVKLIFTHQGGQSVEVICDDLLREGIFTPKVELPLPGLYAFRLHYTGPQMSDTFELQDCVVYESKHAIPIESEGSDEEITFLKEQQWKIDFDTAATQNRHIRTSVEAVGEVLPRRSAYAEVTSPVEGILRVAADQKSVIPGNSVKAGQLLATLSPPLGAANSWTGRKLAYEYAKTEYQRAERLMKQKAISTREFEEIKRNYLVQKAGHEDHKQSGDSDLFRLRAPISGIIGEITAMPGEKVDAGQKLMTIVDPSRVWLRVNVFEMDYYRMDPPKEASLTVPGLETPIHIPNQDLVVLNMGSLLDRNSRSIPVLLEISNTDHRLKIGQTLQVDLYAGDGVPVPCVPSSAVFLDEAEQVVFVQKGGESFEKRSVKTGSRDKGWISILEGLQEGERVVTQGGYLVKLASSSAAIGHPHAH